MKLLLLALGAMFLQQTFVSFGRIMPPVVAPAIIADLGISPAWIGYYAGLTAFFALFVQMGCGSFIVRYGSMRMSQFALVALGLSLILLTHASLIGFAFSVMIVAGSNISTPASSHLLGRFAPPRYAPLVFSLKQTAVPVGLLVAGIGGPLLTYWGGWRFALWAGSAGCIVFAILLEPLRKTFDDDRVRTRSFHLSDFKATMVSVLGTRALRSLSFASFAFNGMQSVFTAFFVTYLTTIDYTLAAAGFVFSVATSVAVPGRIVWGWLGGYVSPRIVMAGLGFGIAISAATVSQFDANWPKALISLAAAALSSTALSWHGVLLAETARLAPPDARASVTGGVLSCGQVGSLLMPITYSITLGLTGNYGLGFLLCGIPSLLVGFDMLRREHASTDPA